MKRLISILLATVCLVPGCSKMANPGLKQSEADVPSTPTEEKYSAIVTVKQDAAGTIFFQLDDETRIYPDNYTEPYKGMCRIICGIILYGNRCTVLWMDYLEEGNMPDEWGAVEGPDSDPDPGSGFKDDGLDILDDWMTSVEDGFLTVHYSTWWGEGNTPHSFRLLKNELKPNELTLQHSRNGEEPVRKADALVYFDINSFFPPTAGDYVSITLNWTTSEGNPASKIFRFRSRQ